MVRHNKVFELTAQCNESSENDKIQYEATVFNYGNSNAILKHFRPLKKSAFPTNMVSGRSCDIFEEALLDRITR